MQSGHAKWDAKWPEMSKQSKKMATSGRKTAEMFLKWHQNGREIEGFTELAS